MVVGVVDFITLRQQTTHYSATKLSAEAKTGASGAQSDPSLLFFPWTQTCLRG